MKKVKKTKKVTAKKSKAKTKAKAVKKMNKPIVYTEAENKLIEKFEKELEAI